MFEGQTASRRLAAGLGFAAALLAASPASAGEQLTPHAFHKLVERTRPALLRVLSKPAGMAVLVGVEGQLLAPLDLVRKGALTVELDGKRLEARLARADEKLGVALLLLEPGSYPAAPAGSAARLEKGRFLLGLSLDRRGRLVTGHGHFDRVLPGKKGLPSLRTDVACGSNAALFNSRGELVALRVARRRATIPIEAIQAGLAREEQP